jgi:hypothetical protein
MDELKPLLFLIFSGLLLRYTLVYVGQAWAKTHAQTITFMILPIITYVITKTISGNIALSLGMIGALSIVRFRHPVKSALELVIYFDLITLGIATSVRTKWAIQLIICTIAIIIIAKVAQNLFKKRGQNFYENSFSEGSSSNILEIFANKSISIVENNKNLINSIQDHANKQFIYRMSFENKKDLLVFKDNLKEEVSIEKINAFLS